MLLLMLSFVLKSLVVMHHFRAVWMISLCHMLIQKKIIIISSVTEILHINVIQCQLILMKHLSSFLRMTILIYSILNLGYCISSPLWLYSISGISSCIMWLVTLATKDETSRSVAKACFRVFVSLMWDYFTGRSETTKTKMTVNGVYLDHDRKLKLQ